MASWQYLCLWTKDGERVQAVAILTTIDVVDLLLVLFTFEVVLNELVNNAAHILANFCCMNFEAAI